MKKKILAVLLAGMMAFSMAACGSANDGNADSNKENTDNSGADGSEADDSKSDDGESSDDGSNDDSAPASDMNIAMITDSGDITDQSFNQTTYETSKAWAEANNVQFTY